MTWGPPLPVGDGGWYGLSASERERWGFYERLRMKIVTDDLRWAYRVAIGWLEEDGIFPPPAEVPPPEVSDLLRATMPSVTDWLEEQGVIAPPVIKPRYTEPMPTDEWLNAHTMLGFFVTNEEAKEFRAKCAEAGISQSDALRGVLAATLEGGKRKRKA